MEILDLRAYYKKIVKQLKKELHKKSIMEVPKIEKVTLNIGIGKIRKDEKKIKHIVDDIAVISGQKPIIVGAKKSIAGFSLRKAEAVGIKVVLRKKRMYDFLSRLINFALPRTRDFKGIKKDSLDKKGNLSIGIKEQTVFPEFSPEQEIKYSFPFEVCITIQAKDREEAWFLLRKLNFPIKDS